MMFKTDTEIFKPCSKVYNNSEEIIYVTRSALEKLALLADVMKNLEFRTIAGALKTDTGERKTIVDFIVADRQDASGGTCAIDEEGETNTIREVEEKGLLYVGIAHGHGTSFSAFHSLIDDKAIKKILNMCYAVNRTKKTVEVNLAELVLNFPQKTTNAMHKAKFKAQLAYEATSHVASIVVNYKKEYYAELDFENEDLLKKQSEHYKKIAEIKEVNDLDDYRIKYSRADALKDLVKKVFFPSKEEIPDAFTEYVNVYKKKPDELAIKFTEELIKYLQNPESRNIDVIRNTLDRIDKQFAERIKISSNHSSHILDHKMIHMFCANCPKESEEFIENFAYPPKQQNREDVIEKNLNMLLGLYQSNKPREMLGFEVKIPVRTCPNELPDEFAELEKLCKSENNAYLKAVSGFIRLAKLVSKEFTLNDLVKIGEAKNTIKAIMQKAMDHVYDALAKNNFSLNALLEERGHKLVKEMVVPNILPEEVYKKIESFVTMQAKYLDSKCSSLMDKMKEKACSWELSQIKRFAENKEKITKEVEQILRYQHTFPSEYMERLQAWNSCASDKPIKDFLQTIQNNIFVYKNKKNSERLIRKEYELLELKSHISCLDELDAASGKKFHEDIEKIKKEYEVL